MAEEGVVRTVTVALATLKEELSEERVLARSTARFDLEREIAGVLTQLEDAAQCIQKIEAGRYLTPAETAQGAALARTILLRKSTPDAELYWAAITTLLAHSRRII